MRKRAGFLLPCFLLLALGVGCQGGSPTTNDPGPRETYVPAHNDRFAIDVLPTDNPLVVVIGLRRLSAGTAAVMAPDSRWNLYLADGSPLRQKQTLSNPVLNWGFWRDLDSVGSLRGDLDLRELVDAKDATNGWYQCRIRYSDVDAAGVATGRKFPPEGVVGSIDSNPIEVRVFDGAVIAWRQPEKLR